MPALLTAQNCRDNIHLVVGAGPLAASRCTKSLEVSARPILIAPEHDDIHFSLAKRVEDGSVIWTKKDFEDSDLTTLGREEVDHIVDAVFVTTGSKHPLSIRISSLYGPLQIGITTSGRGCKLASRIRREIATLLPRDFGAAVDRLGTIRRKIWEEDKLAELRQGQENTQLEEEDEETENQKHTFNTLVKEAEPDPELARTRRMRWLSQICEYWPLKRLAAISDDDIAGILNAYRRNSHSHQQSVQQAVEAIKARKGTITLAGSGPGHASMLTVATHEAIKNAHYILADKLVPAEILELIPRRTPVHIARKFPGNADAAQDEMHELALAAMKEGKDVLRLKQGDPYLYGRGAEEVVFFRERGFQVRVLPGITSALSAPLFAGIPVTHRAVADQVVICTGTGRKGAAPEPPSYRKSKTVVFLMALHRLDALINSLTGGEDTVNVRKPWPKTTPCAVIERASCPDQRVIRSTLEHVCRAIEVEGSRPPGLIVVGAACEVLHQLGSDKQWIVEEGFKGLDQTPDGTNDLVALQEVRDQSLLEDIQAKVEAKSEVVSDVSMPVPTVTDSRISS
ncbi:uroporphyrin-III C-methyltransferase [Lithohypha guttulata]|uniref:Uroporphyrin-III C-methyltransferase n=1 Tax=Lithohypha guttulata TaxID=1690604 RepID=A0AAN7T3U8_9EURO|nr:uroporphyrin-III C-methyltransferase [Lithohypha guttulata]